MNTKQLLEKYYEAWSQQAPDRVMDFFVADSTFEDLAFAAKFDGLEQIRSFVDLTYAGVPDFKVVPTSIVAQDNRAAAQWLMSGTHSGDFPGMPATGKTFEVRAISAIEFREDKILTIVDYWNPVDFQQQVGLL